MKNIITSLSMTIVGTFLVALAINLVSVPNELGDGGVTGLTLFFHYTLNFDIPKTAFVLNVIILIIGWKLLNKLTIIYTLISIAALSFFLQVIQPAPFIPDNQLVAPLVSGVIMGTGLGIVIRGGGSTGGTDILALIVNKYTGISVSNALLMFDGVIISLLFFAIGLEKGAISIVGILLYSRILNFWVTGYNPKNALFIISHKHEEIGNEIMDKVKRGVTIFSGYGFYSKKQRQILYVVVSNRQLMAVKKIVHNIDPKAFIAVNDVQQVDGEGFTFLREPEEMTLETDESILNPNG
ncbi:YitT family protein [Facklamia miroungae]|uniref:Uncharacterized membrane-anchored protein YitT, contains DUF161 and DUF2179 domains n=1 Tax=Facklamia miroungae TaxID=120956 RepID=A0A1G7TGS5_9LACT|nr:YitT family protein [Facklamia miroungae]NKZ29838.1 YitT family protein [Facklamia miroungae]SDG34567.1 Uncharacterized membrane-anchored protein YitT, contains DUF161 and DUF2179 domains [Facklamia miroungae]